MVLNALPATLVLVLFCIFTFASSAHAEMVVVPEMSEQDSPAPVTYSAAVGGNWVWTLPDGESMMGYTTASFIFGIPIKGRFSILPSIGFEVAPWYGNYGVFGGVSFDFLVADWLALDLNVVMVHDEDPLLKADRGEATTGYFAFGPSLAFILPNGLALAPGVQFITSLEGMGWCFSPGLGVVIPIP